MEREQKTQWHLVEETSWEAKGGPSVNYFSHADATPEGELAALADVYALVIRAHEREKADASQNKVGKEANNKPAVGSQPVKPQPRRTA